MANPVDIFAQSDYRAFLKEWLTEAKKKKTFNLSRLSEAANVHPTFLSHVLNGTKHLSLEQAAAMASSLGLTRLELDYFVTLIQLDRAGTPALRSYWQEKKQQLEKEKNKLSQRFEKHHELTEDQRVTFYSSWLYLAAWVSTAINDGQTLDQIARRFQIEKTQAEEVMAFLVQTGVCKEHRGKFTMGEMHVHVPNESPHVTKHHMNWRMKAVQKIDTRDDTELFFSAPMSISRKDFGLLRERLRNAINETVAIAKESPAEDLFCLNIDLFKPRP